MDGDHQELDKVTKYILLSFSIIFLIVIVVVDLCRSHQSYKTVDSDMRGVRRSLFLVALIVLVIVTVIVLLTRVGREVANKDAALDWNLNPNLRTGN